MTMCSGFTHENMLMFKIITLVYQRVHRATQQNITIQKRGWYRAQAMIQTHGLLVNSKWKYGSLGPEVAI